MAYLLLPKNSTSSSGANLAVISMDCDQWPDMPGGPYWGSYYIRLNFVTIQCSLDSRVLLTRSAHFLSGEKKKRAALLSGSGYLCFSGSSAFLHSLPPTSFSLWPTFFGSQLLASLWDTKIPTSVKCTLARKASKEARLFNFYNIMVNREWWDQHLLIFRVGPSE